MGQWLGGRVVLGWDGWLVGLVGWVGWFVGLLVCLFFGLLDGLLVWIGWLAVLHCVGLCWFVLVGWIGWLC